MKNWFYPRRPDPDDPFTNPVRCVPMWQPPEMRDPPVLSDIPTGSPERRYALLINPFYPKDPHASFGKHVLTPTLALTSIAGATPPEWRVEYWDEKPAARPPAFSTDAAGGRHHRAPDLRQAGVCLGGLVSTARFGGVHYFHPDRRGAWRAVRPHGV